MIWTPLQEVIAFQNYFLQGEAMQTLRCTLDVPPSANKRLKPFINKSGKFQASFFQTSESKNYQAANGWVIASAMKVQKIKLMKNRCKVCIVWHKNKKMGDLPDRFKDVYDSLNTVLWDDDSQVSETHLFHTYDKETMPRIDLIVRECSIKI